MDETNTLGTRLEGLRALRTSQEAPPKFWSDLLARLGQEIGADFGFLCVLEAPRKTWKTVSDWSSDRHSNLKGLSEEIIHGLASQVLEQGLVEVNLSFGEQKEAVSGMVGLRLLLGEGQPDTVVIYHLPLTLCTSSQRGQRALLLELVADLPRSHSNSLALKSSQEAADSSAKALDLLVLINEDQQFLKAAMTLCNEFAARFRCVRVCFGWVEGEYVQVQAISHLERFKRNLEAVQSLESAMEEACDQDQEILWPQPEGGEAITRDHERLSKSEGVDYLLSLPIRAGGEVLAVVTCERVTEPFSESEIYDLRLFCDVVSRRLVDLKSQDRWLGAKLAHGLRQSLTGLLGPENTLGKMLGFFGMLMVLYLSFAQWDYRVEADFQLQTDSVIFLTAPFDGFLADSFVELGHGVAVDQSLARLDVRELHLEESTILADILAHTLSADKAKATGKLADMRIAQAKRKQSWARLERVRYMLEHAEIRSPMDGIVVEGELGKMIGSPLRKGEVLVKLATIGSLYVEVEVDESEIHEVRQGAKGEISFRSQPDITFPIEVEIIHPVAVAREQANLFLVRAKPNGEQADWWRPGMSGVAKITVGPRNVFWILSHRTVNLLRLLFWY
ncbi:MAG: efflux RND transporter periplasmic adaptor subunit [Magnetococcales bacterium]|nr:efflux RND transporter periplasmic adaptor subunit [Magnetococcales bacterium]